ncbi:hypothetical protein BS78_02G152200 [Paspalum vaginatum]|nr:hypothetical protein BS78_02G152200 [Paspalum vaginatum]
MCRTRFKKLASELYTMDAKNAAVAVDLEKGGGVIAEAMMPWPADERLEEKRPFAWLPVAPFVAVALVGVAMVGLGLHLAHHYEKTAAGGVGAVLYFIGFPLAGVAAMAGAAIAGECGLQQLGPVD